MSRARSMLDIIGEHLNSDELKLPTYSPVAARLQELVNRPDTDARAIEEVILQDPALSGQILKMSNSAFYSGLSKVATVDQAIRRLGMHEVVNLVVVSTQSGLYRAETATIAAWMTTLWRHSLACALGAKWLARQCGYRERAGEAFLAGLFHDIGKLLLLKVFDDLGNAPGAEAFPEALMAEVLAAQHPEQGARLLEHWNLSETYVNIARGHHVERVDDSNPLGAIVRLVDQACTKVGINLVPDPGLVLSASPEAALLGIREVTIAELEITLEDAIGSLAQAA